MQMCSRCHKRAAVVFISHMENGKQVNSGLCMPCATELNIGPVNDMIKNLGITPEDLENMNGELEAMIEANEDIGGDNENVDENGVAQEARAPSIDFGKLFGGGIFPPGRPNPNNNPGNGPKKKDKNAQKQEPSRKMLSQYCLNLNGRAREGKLDRIVGRERELGRLMQILCRRQKNNPCLIGEPGVGKTAIAEALAQRIVDGNVPFKLRDKEIELVDLTALVAGTQFRGQFEARIKSLINEVKALGNIILVIDEVHSIVGAGEAEGSMNAANILKPALSRGDIQLIGATTLNEYRKYIEKDSALERRFQPIIVEEPSSEDTVKILLGIKGYYEDFHGVTIPPEIVRRAVYLSERYITDRYLPDKAIDLLDEAASYLALSTPVIGEYAELSRKMALNRTERERLETEVEQEQDERKREEKYRRLADLRVSELNDGQRLAELSEQCKNVVLTTEDLAKVIEIWTGIPASNITEHEFGRISKLADRLKKRIVGQDEAVDAVARAIKRNRAGVSYKKKPTSFIFAGPTGVGKTELVKTLAADLFDSPESLIRLDMSEFMEKHSVSRIIGSPPGYVGYDEAGQLTEKIRRKPYSVVLFDEIEKSHPDVLNILLQILDDGRITDAQGRTVSFENTIIVMTTNAGSSIITNSAGFASTQNEQNKERTLRALNDFLRPEFLNRVDEIITFRQLDEKDFVEIAKIMLGDLKGVMEDKGMTLTFTERAAQYVAVKSYSKKFGARNMRRFISVHIEDVIADKLISEYDLNLTSITIDVNEENSDLIIEVR